jgi:hypothetical protein
MVVRKGDCKCMKWVQLAQTAVRWPDTLTHFFFSRQLILKCLGVGDDHYLQHPYQCFIHHHPVLAGTAETWFTSVPSPQNLQRGKICLLPDLYKSMPMTICSPHSTLTTLAFEKCCYITLQSENQLKSKFCYACSCIN